MTKKQEFVEALSDKDFKKALNIFKKLVSEYNGRLNLSYSGYDDETSTELLQFLKENNIANEVIELNLSYSSSAVKSIKEILDLISLCNLKSLILDCTKLNNDSLKQLLNSSYNLEKLSIKKNNLDDTAGNLIAQLIPGTHITEIDVTDNNLSSKVIKDIADSSIFLKIISDYSTTIGDVSD